MGTDYYKHKKIPQDIWDGGMTKEYTNQFPIKFYDKSGAEISRANVEASTFEAAAEVTPIPTGSYTYVVKDVDSGLLVEFAADYRKEIGWWDKNGKYFKTKN